MNIEEVTKTLLEMNVNEFTEKKQSFTYLSWSQAWRKVIETDPRATYKILKNPNRDMMPLFGDEENGYFCYTEVTIEGVTREMWLCVLDFRNKACKNPDSGLINKTVMRCLTKNLAMFGLGTYIYAGESYPTETDLDGVSTPKGTPKADPKAELIKRLGVLSSEQKKFYIDAFNKKTKKDAKDWKDTTVTFLKQVVAKAL